MIPPVPLALRLALSAACLLVSKTGFALAGWISPELKLGRVRQVGEGSPELEARNRQVILDGWQSERDQDFLDTPEPKP